MTCKNRNYYNCPGTVGNTAQTISYWDVTSTKTDSTNFRVIPDSNEFVRPLQVRLRGSQPAEAGMKMHCDGQKFAYSSIIGERSPMSLRSHTGSTKVGDLQPPQPFGVMKGAQSSQ